MKARLVVLLILSMSFSAFIVLPETTSSTTLYVGGAGPGNHTTIQGAVDAASPGDTVYVYSGTYHENIVITEVLSLAGENEAETIIDGGYDNDVIDIYSDWVNVSALTLRYGSADLLYSGLKIHGNDNCTITNNTIHGNTVGIVIDEAAGNLIADNTVFNNYRGVSLFRSSNNTIVNNTLFWNNVVGIDLALSDNNTITGNHIFEAWSSAGVSLSHSHNNTIVSNIITASERAISLDSSGSNSITHNIVSDCPEGIFLSSSDGNLIHHNNVTNTTYPARDDSGDNFWDNGYPSGGNYWSDYDGEDTKSGPLQDQAGSDGMGDSPYGIILGKSEDRYPLMNPAAITLNPPRDQPPSCTITSPRSSHVVNGPPPTNVSGTIAITGIASDLDGTVERIELHINGEALAELPGSESWSYLWNTTTVSDGDYTITARAFDGKLYSKWVAETVTVDNIPPPEDSSGTSWLWAGAFLVAVAIAIAVALVVLVLVMKGRSKGSEK
jgi:parallel beta-helix repeat protein